MKKLYLKFICALFSIYALEMNAQMSNYGFSSTTGTYTPISGGTVLNSGTGLDLDSIYANVPIGFDFKFDFQTYNQLQVSANGFVFFGSANKGFRTSYKLTPLIAKTILFGLSSTGPAEGVISALGFNYVSANASAELRFETKGSAPNRKFVVQWSNVKRSGDASMNASFQLVLSETSNLIEIIYGTCNPGSLTTGGNIGIRGGNVQDFQSRLNGSSGVTWTASAVGTAASSFVTYGSTSITVPPLGLTYTYTPSFPTLAVPTYAALGAITNFDGTWINVKSTGDVPNNSWRAWPAFGNNSWKINTNTGGGWTSVATGTPTIAAPASNEAARFHTAAASNTNNGVLDYYFNASANTNNKTLSFDFINPDGNDSLKILFSKDNGKTFVALDSIGISSAWITRTVALGNTDSAQCVIRFSAYKTSTNSSDIAIDNVSVSGSTCSVPPIGGLAGTTTLSVVSGQNIDLTLSGQVGNVQWQDSTSGSALFNDIPGATNANYNFQITRPGIYYYRNRANSISCPNSFSNVISVLVTPISGDDACDAITLNTGLNGPFNLQFASTQSNEVIPPNGVLSTSQTGWSGTVSNPIAVTRSMWFKFIAPASKKVRIASNFGGLINNDTQLALWDVNNCNQLTTNGGGAILIAANDDSTGSLRNSFISDTVMCLTPGKTYYVQVDPYSNSLSAPVFIRLETVNASNANFSGLPSAVCLGAAAITLTPTILGGTFSSNVIGNAYTVPSTAGLDSISYTVGGACPVTNKQFITINALPNVGATTSVPSVCQGDSVVFNGTGAITYTWTGGVANGIAFVPNAPNQYLVTGTDANGCIDTLTIFFNVANKPNVGILSAPNDSVCNNNGQVSLSGSGANTYVWNNGVIDGVPFNVTNTGTYQVIGSLANGCSDTSSITITAVPAPIVNLGGFNQSTCNPSLLLDAGNIGSTYVWNNGGTSPTLATSQTYNVSSSGIYTAFVTNSFGCVSSDSVSVTLNSILVANLGASADTVCEGSPLISLTGSPSGGTFSANASAGTFSPNLAGTFVVSYFVTNVCGTDTADLSILVNPLPIVSYTTSDPDTFCANKVITLTGIPSGGVFTVSQGNPSALSGNIFNAPTTGTYQVVYTFIDPNACSDTAQKTFVVSCITGFETIAARGISEVSILPNPNNGKFDLNIMNVNSDNASIKILSVDGRVLIQNQVALDHNNTISLDIAALSNGIYYLNLVSGQLNKTIKIVKQ